ncbi:MAG: hypothetical protein HC888_16715 [Candidatus Competibacteraceae bacterium]|nr:hypothetical protein [Candidatus Competibacteraceae bacterium]
MPLEQVGPILSSANIHGDGVHLLGTLGGRIAQRSADGIERAHFHDRPEHARAIAQAQR